jgi:formylglycine-generating enzyme required for sulfatase activity
MGCDEVKNPDSCPPQSTPLHTVYLDAYYIDKYEVTNAQYQKCVDAGVCNKPGVSKSNTRPSYYDNPAFVYVNATHAETYCSWAGARLPTEAEWEKAARGAGNTNNYPWGDGSPSCALLNYKHTDDGSNYQACEGDDTSEVGSYPGGASPYGVEDMAGNVWEWVGDRFQSFYYSRLPSLSENPHGPDSGSSRIIKGGSWFEHWGYARVFTREEQPNGGGTVYHNVGFRCARSSD